MDFLKSLEILRNQNKKRNFDQTLDLIINLKNFDPNKETINTFVLLPHPFKKKRIAAFLESIKNVEGISLIINKSDIEKISPKEMKKYIKEYDLFIANAKLMPLIASKFGKILGSAGKMPDPKIGSIILEEQKETIQQVLEKLQRIVKIKSKEKSLKIPVAKESMPNEKIIENIEKTFKTVLEVLPKKEQNIKNIMLKFTMSKTIKVD